MRLPWRRKAPWPAHLERRRPENAAVRAQLEKAHKEQIRLTADKTEQLAAENASRVRQVEATVTALTARLGLSPKEN